jgi:hypothetical protein
MGGWSILRRALIGDVYSTRYIARKLLPCRSEKVEKEN